MFCCPSVRRFKRGRGVRATESKVTCSHLSIVRFDNGPKRSMGHLLGGEKIFFLIRDIDGPAMTAASMESCRFAARRSPWGRLGS